MINHVKYVLRLLNTFRECRRQKKIWPLFHALNVNEVRYQITILPELASLPQIVLLAARFARNSFSPSRIYVCVVRRLTPPLHQTVKTEFRKCHAFSTYQRRKSQKNLHFPQEFLLGICRKVEVFQLLPPLIHPLSPIKRFRSKQYG